LGCIASSAGVETPEINTAKVESIVEDFGKTLTVEVPKEFDRFKSEMKFKHPEPWEVDKDVGDAKVKLQWEVDDDKKVKKTALLACAGNKFKSDAESAVWDQLSPDIQSKLADKNELAQKAGMKAGQTASNKATDVAVDKLIKKYADQIEKGEL